MRRFEISILLLLPVFAVAQPPQQFRLQASSSVSRAQSIPMLDQDGNCTGWFDASRSVLFDAQGRTLIPSAGKILKQATNADGSIDAVLEKTAARKAKAAESFFTVRFFNRSGQSRGSYQFSQHRDDPLPNIIFEARGEHLLLAYPATARLIFLENSGQVLRKVSLFREAPYANERPLFVAASAGAFIVLSQKTPSTPAKAVTPTLFYFSAQGEEWRRELPAGTAGGLAISSDGHWIAANRYAVIGTRVEATNAVFNFQGEPQATIAGLFRRAVFANNGSSLLLMDRRQLRAIDFHNGKELWQITPARRAEIFVDIAATATHDKIFTLVAENAFKENRFVFEKARLLGFDRVGRQQTEILLPNQLLAPVLKISNDGSRLTLGAEGFLQQFTTVEPSR